MTFDHTLANPLCSTSVNLDLQVKEVLKKNDINISKVARKTLRQYCKNRGFM